LSFQVVHEPPPPPAPVEPSAQPNAFDSAQLAAQVQDLKEKLIVVQSRRQEEKSRNKELERYKLLYEQMSEYKNKWSSSQSDLNQQLKQAKKDAKEAQEEKAKMEEELIELQEAVEMATLDKEMAEERVRCLSVVVPVCAYYSVCVCLSVCVTVCFSSFLHLSVLCLSPSLSVFACLCQFVTDSLFISV
jgi:hypothetical protein